MESVTIKEIRRRFVEKIADNMFVSSFHDKQGNKDVATNMIVKAIGVADFARDFGFNEKELQEEAYRIYETRRDILLRKV